MNRRLFFSRSSHLFQVWTNERKEILFLIDALDSISINIRLEQETIWWQIVLSHLRSHAYGAVGNEAHE